MKEPPTHGVWGVGDALGAVVDALAGAVVDALAGAANVRTVPATAPSPKIKAAAVPAREVLIIARSFSRSRWQRLDWLRKDSSPALPGSSMNSWLPNSSELKRSRHPLSPSGLSSRRLQCRGAGRHQLPGFCHECVSRDMHVSVIVG